MLVPTVSAFYCYKHIVRVRRCCCFLYQVLRVKELIFNKVIVLIPDLFIICACMFNNVIVCPIIASKLDTFAQMS